MKISKIQSQYLNNDVSANDRINKHKTRQDKSVDVQISDAARKLSDKINRAEESEMNEKVEKIRLSILNGSYKVPNEELADKLLQEIQLQKDSENL